METSSKTVINIEAAINAPVEKVWICWTEPKYIVHWNNASDDWHTPGAENDLRIGGKFLFRMEAKDGSSGFDFTGEYTNVEEYRLIEYVLDDGRKVKTSFTSDGKVTRVAEAFEAESLNPVEMQREGWQAILDNFKNFVESPEKPGVMHCEINIGAKPEKVYKTMLAEKSYAEWTSVFDPSSHFKGSWDKGSKILFLGSGEDGSVGGMVSRIRENVPYRFVSIEHLGLIENSLEIYSGEKVEKWAGALENYTFIDNNGTTLLEVDVDVNNDYRSYFDTTWPEALKKLKEICESPDNNEA
jgi:uncharacterized protein YndB with AHSA1/START domain